MRPNPFSHYVQPGPPETLECHFAFRSNKLKMPNKHKGMKKSRKGTRGGAKASIKGFGFTASFFPPSMRGKLMYSEDATLAVPAGSVASNVYRGNSIFDPDYSGTGTTVRNYTQVQAIYGKYRVYSVEVTVNAFPVFQTSACRTQLMVAVSNDLTLGTSVKDWSAQRWVKTVPMYNGNGVTCSFKIPVHTVFGVPASLVATEDDFGSVIGSNPGNGIYIHVGCYNWEGVALNMPYQIRLAYDTKVELPKALTI